LETRGKLREKGCAGETERAGGRERAGAREIHQQESGRGTRSRSSPVRTRSPAPMGEVAARPPPSRAAACAGCGHVPPIGADLQHLEERGKQETERGGGGAVVENERERDATALERGVGVREMKQAAGRSKVRGIWAAWWAGPDYFLLLLLSFPFSFLFFFIIYHSKLLF